MKALGMFFICLICSVSMNTADAASVSLNTNYFGSARDMNADGIFESFSPSLIVHAQKTNFQNIFTVRRGMLEFDISSITSPVDSVTLSFDVAGGAGPNTTVNVWGYEGDGDVNLADSYLGESLLGSIDMNDSRVYSFSLDVTNYVDYLLKKDSQFAGFNLRMSSEYSTSMIGYNNEAKIWTNKNSNIFHKPELTVSVVPLPASLWLFVSGLLVVTTLARVKGGRNFYHALRWDA